MKIGTQTLTFEASSTTDGRVELVVRSAAGIRVRGYISRTAAKGLAKALRSAAISAEANKLSKAVRS